MFLKFSLELLLPCCAFVLSVCPPLPLYQRFSFQNFRGLTFSGPAVNNLWCVLCVVVGVCELVLSCSCVQ